MLAAPSPDQLAPLVFIALSVTVAVARIVGALFRKIRQPPVVGEIMAGIILGPSLLGALPGQLPSRVFGSEVRPILSVLAQIGLIIFMFIVGLELDPSLMRGKERGNCSGRRGGWDGPGVAGEQLGE